MAAIGRVKPAAPMQDSARPAQPEVAVQAGETPDTAVVTADMPMLADPKTLFLGGLFVLALLAAVYVAQEIVVPLIMAFCLKQLMLPLLRVLARWRVPRPIMGALALILLGTVLLTLMAALSVPAASWGKTISEGFPRLERHLAPLQGPIAGLQDLLGEAQHALTGDNGNNQKAVAVDKMGALDLVFSGTRAALEGLVLTAAILFFLIVAGDTFLRRAVEILPNFENKRRAVEIALQVEHDISVYLFTIAGMNLAVGVAVGTAMALCGMGDPLLWGAVAFVLNFVPILGPLTGIGLFVLLGFMQEDTVGAALLPGALYLCVHLIEGELVTPALLARRFTLNPVAVILSIIFWYWMWGVFGAVLAVPMLAIIKILCDHVRPLAVIGHFLEGEERVADRYVTAYAKKRSSTRS